MEALLASLRKNAGLTQDMAAKELGVCQSTISMWESGASKPRIEMLKRIATVCGGSANVPNNNTDEQNRTYRN